MALPEKIGKDKYRCPHCDDYEGTMRGLKVHHGKSHPKYTLRKKARPTKYSPDLVDEVYDYVDNCKDEVTVKDGTERKKVNLPTIAGLAVKFKVGEDTVHAWKKKHEDFSKSLKYLLMKQRQKLKNEGLAGFYNSTIAKLILMNNHGYKERQDTTSGDDPIGKEAKLNDEDRELLNKAIENAYGQDEA